MHINTGWGKPSYCYRTMVQVAKNLQVLGSQSLQNYNPTSSEAGWLIDGDYIVPIWCGINIIWTFSCHVVILFFFCPHFEFRPASSFCHILFFTYYKPGMCVISDFASVHQLTAFGEPGLLYRYFLWDDLLCDVLCLHIITLMICIICVDGSQAK